MDTSSLKRISEFEWHIEPTGNMRVPGILYASEDLVSAMDEKVLSLIHISEPTRLDLASRMPSSA